MLYQSGSAKETQKIAARLAAKVAMSKNLRHAPVIALEGKLGAGKTTFVKAFAEALGVKQKLTSPTFVLMRHYPLSTIHYSLLYHIDAYRLKNYKDLLPLGVKEIIAEPENIVLIEWAERVKPILPKKCIWVHMDYVGERERKITIK